MSVRRIVVASLDGGEDIEQTTFEVNDQRTVNNNVSAPLSHDITYQSNAEHLLFRKYSLLTMPEDTWLELQLTADAEAMATESQHHHLPIFGPNMYQRNYEKALFFTGDSHWKKLRSIVIFCVTIVMVISYVYLSMDVMILIGKIMECCESIPLVIALYCYTGISTTDGRPGSALRVFSLLKESDRLLLKKRHFSYNAIVLFTAFVSLLLHYTYCFVRWEMIPLWGQVCTIIIIPWVFIPHIAIFSLFPLFSYVADISDRLFAQQKIFVYNQESDSVNWIAVQKNFDICESIVNDISKGFQLIFVGALFCLASTTSHVIGTISQFLSWQAAGYQPFSIVILLVCELLSCIQTIALFINIWSAASQITAACDGVLDQCSSVLAYLHMSPSFQNSTDEYLRAQLFHTYVEKANLGFKVFGVRISYALATSIVVPFVSILSVVFPIVFKSH